MEEAKVSSISIEMDMKKVPPHDEFDFPCWKNIGKVYDLTKTQVSAGTSNFVSIPIKRIIENAIQSQLRKD